MAVRRSLVTNSNMPFLAMGLVFLCIGWFGPLTSAYEDGTAGVGTLIVGVSLIFVGVLDAIQRRR